jgi:HEAT repeat protein
MSDKTGKKQEYEKKSLEQKQQDLTAKYKTALEKGDFEEIVILISRMFREKLEPELILGMLVGAAAEKGGEYADSVAKLINDFDQRAAPVLFKVLSSAEFPLSLKRAAAVNLGYCHDKQYEEILVSSLDDPELSAYALHGLIELSPRLGVQLCTTIIKQRREDLFDQALTLLRWSHLDGSEVSFVEMLQDDLPQVRKLALEKLYRLNYTASIERIASLAKEDPDEEVRALAVDTLKKWKAPAAQEAYAGLS